jgi:hypothetical protein
MAEKRHPGRLFVGPTDAKGTPRGDIVSPVAPGKDDLASPDIRNQLSKPSSKKSTPRNPLGLAGVGRTPGKVRGLRRGNSRSGGRS